MVRGQLAAPERDGRVFLIIGRVVWGSPFYLQPIQIWFRLIELVAESLQACGKGETHQF